MKHDKYESCGGVPARLLRRLKQNQAKHSRQCPRPFSPPHFRPISQLFSRLCSRLVLDPVLSPPRHGIPRNGMLPSRPVNHMASHLYVPFPSRGKKKGIFSHTVHREDPKNNPPAAGETVPSGTARCPCVFRKILL